MTSYQFQCIAPGLIAVAVGAAGWVYGAWKGWWML